MKQTIKKMILGPVDWFTYSVLTERQRKAIGDMFSDEQKQVVKKVLTGKKQAERQKLKKIKYHLYNLGFTAKASQELEAYFENAKDPELKRLAAWELVLWHANQNTADGAAAALDYIDAAKQGVSDEQQLRRIAILEAECYQKTNQIQEAKRVIEKMLEEQKHADLYLAAANLTPSVKERFELVNEVMQAYDLAPIRFAVDEESATYEDLETEPVKNKTADGPKVSVILPAFKAEEGIRVAIESILSQTWKNIELLAVDDCSPDNTAAVIQEYVDKDPRVRLLKTPHNSGPYVARNIALKEATGEFITINDADDWSHAEKIERQVKHLLANPAVIANTSEHARLTEELTFYRRGTPGKYIFPNMSSIMFRREPVIEKIGYWDSVRFAADGEFKRRLIKVFGKNSYVDLETGPLSLPRQSVTSLTASSAFGYNGFFMGVRREYVEALSYHHAHAASVRYPYPMENRPFQVPEPMWPRREEKVEGKRQFDLIIATDFRASSDKHLQFIQERLQTTDDRIGLLQIFEYGIDPAKTIPAAIREMLDGDGLQVVVFGEKLVANQVVLFRPTVLAEYQRYVPIIETAELDVVVDQLPEDTEVKATLENLRSYFNQNGKWYPETAEIKEKLEQEASRTDSIPYQADVWNEKMGVR